MPRGPMSEEAKAKMRAKREANTRLKEIKEDHEFAMKQVASVVLQDDSGRVMQGINNLVINSGSEMNILAKRIFEGQSPNLPERTRVERVLNGLKGQGYTDFSSLDLPIKELKKYL